MTTAGSHDGALLITDIGTLMVVPPGPLAGRRQEELERLTNAAVLVRDRHIAWFGPARKAPLDEGVLTLSAAGGCVIPGLIDAHTHIPFCGDRSDEFVRRIRGETYLQIMQAGGGIRATTRAVRAASLDELVAENLPVLGRMLEAGVTRVECKSGYGLSPEHELKQLEAIRELDRQQPIDLEPTFLGAHALPEEYAGRADDFVEAIASTALLEDIVRQRLARFCDVFCDEGAFTVEQARRILTRARDAGLRPKMHADELAQIGASRLAGDVGAVSADHLEHVDDAGLTALRAASTVAVVLPGTSFYLGMPHCNVRRLIDAEIPVALATDYNPGSCPIESLPWIMSIACCQLRMRPTEVLVACTANAAAALALEHHVGAIHAGYEADLVVLDAPTPEAWLYTPGRSRVRAVVKGGAVVYRRPEHART